MATFNFFASQKGKPVVQSTSVVLTKHNAVEKTSEYYSYYVNGKEMKYVGSLVKKGDSYIGKLNEANKVILTYHEGVASIKPVDAYFTYVDNGKEFKFNGNPIFDEETQTYTGELPVDTLKDTVIDIYPVEK